MSPEERARLIDLYAQGPDEVARALAGFPADRLTAHPVAGKWSAAEIVHHLADSESISAIRIRRLVAEDRAVITGYDQERYAVVMRYNVRPIEPSLAQFRGVREGTVPLLRILTEEEWKRPGWHTEMGAYSPETWLSIYGPHAHDHAGQIVRLREALAK
jgi:DinB superfamily